MLIILLASIPLYVCATGSVPIAAVLIMKGLSPGAALVFLMAGPATNAATISVIGNAMGRKTLFRYLVSIISGAVFFGLLINEFLPREWFTLPVHGMHGNGHEHGILPSWLQNGSAVLLSTLILNSLIRKYLLPHLKTSDNSAKSLNVNNMNTQINVGGMTCNHCKTTVENGIRGIKGVENATADILTGKVIIEGTDPDLKKVEEVVNSLGYKFIR
jgi:copper chaperone CopZ